MADDRELRISITTDAELAAIQKLRKEYVGMIRDTEKGTDTFKDLTAELEKVDEALESNTAKILARRKELEQMMLAQAKAGVDVTETAEEYDNLGESLKDNGIAMADVADSAQVLGTAVQGAGKSTRLFGLSMRQLQTGLKGITRLIPGAAIALRFLGGSLMATMAGFMALGMAVSKITAHFKKLNEEQDKWLKEAAEPTNKMLEANRTMVQNAAKSQTELDIALIKATSHQTTLAERTKTASDSLTDQANATRELQDALREDDMVRLEEIHAKKLISTEEFERQKALIEFKAREDKAKAEEELSQALLDLKRKELEDSKKVNAELLEQAKKATFDRIEAEKQLSHLPTPEALSKRTKEAQERFDKAMKARDDVAEIVKNIESAQRQGGWVGDAGASAAALGRAEEKLQEEFFALNQAQREEAQAPEREAKVTEDLSLKKVTESAAQSVLNAGLTRSTELGISIPIEAKRLALTSDTRKSIGNVNLQTLNRKAALAEYQSRQAGKPAESQAKKARFAQIWGLNTTDEVRDRLLRGLQQVESVESKEEQLARVKDAYLRGEFGTGVAAQREYQRRVQEIQRQPSTRPDVTLQKLDMDIVNAAHGKPLQQFSDGGTVAGPIGSPQLAVVHGGEYVVSNEDLDKATRAKEASERAAAIARAPTAQSIALEDDIKHRLAEQGVAAREQRDARVRAEADQRAAEQPQRDAAIRMRALLRLTNPNYGPAIPEAIPEYGPFRMEPQLPLPNIPERRITLGPMTTPRAQLAHGAGASLGDVYDAYKKSQAVKADITPAPAYKSSFDELADLLQSASNAARSAWHEVSEMKGQTRYSLREP